VVWKPIDVPLIQLRALNNPAREPDTHRQAAIQGRTEDARKRVTSSPALAGFPIAFVNERKARFFAHGFFSRWPLTGWRARMMPIRSPLTKRHWALFHRHIGTGAHGRNYVQTWPGPGASFETVHPPLATRRAIACNRRLVSLSAV